eukprot:CAMPEP_0173180592 /NCGR_PEP_ID=MMETSP1141-20130122/6800_1 /TAXON_ID=483371 /ORGANISM="non described non described, Strain CCMP2298" /LENGTH=1152 /DNA_ID=CAMNT_0014103457 /DNA_START=210 /DNA_END=3668 /DNA_ORIENTATION=-
MCDCFEGHEGNDCSRKSCPKGPALSDSPYALDTAHAEVECSNQGRCDYSTGVCSCSPGFQGRACQATRCFNDCSGRGVCMSLKQAAEFNDGFQFNRTTSYDRWDGEVFSGCKCDPGFSGPDCSQRVCEYGPDPRLSVEPRERVTLICSCFPSCSGKFKLRMFGVPLRVWHKAETVRAFEIADAIMNTPGVWGNNSGHVEAPVIATINTVDDLVCQPNALTTTTINFRRNHGDLPSISFYAQLMTKGSLHFQTLQTLNCDCVEQACNGTFRVSFDGEMSGRLSTWGNGADVTAALAGMATFKAAGLSISTHPDSASTPVCVPGSMGNHSMVITGLSGNAPRIGVWSSVVKDKSPEAYDSVNSSSVLRLTTSDGRDDHVKLCNGIGKCDYATGQCGCPFGWGFDADLGVCGSLQVNTSRYAGLGRCPGVGVLSAPTKDLSGSRNYQTTIYISLNPEYVLKESAQSANKTLSGIYSFAWRPDTIKGPDIDESTRQLFVNLSSNSSAGPLLIDGTRDRIFFVDQHADTPYIGIATLGGPLGNLTVWLSVSYRIFGLTSYAHFDGRRLYWTVPGTTGGDVRDGGIYYADMDQELGTAVSLVAAIGQVHVIDPHGIAIHYKQRRIYWTDKNVTENNRAGVLRSCNFDGSQVLEVLVLRTFDNHTVSTNLTDLVIDFVHNNTAFLLDAGQPSAVIAANLDFPEYYNKDNATGIVDAWVGFKSTRVLANEWAITIGDPTYLGIDDNALILLWSDASEKVINFVRYVKQFLDLFSPGVVYTPIMDTRQKSLREFYPVAMVIDKGLGPPKWDDYTECYGNGVCVGRGGNFECRCNKGFFGDCQARTCPLGKAWFHEPAADNVAHDEQAECSAMGVCDRGTGQCSCRSGFEGEACERLSCQGRISASSACSGRGRCLSLRRLAEQHRDDALASTAVVYGSSAGDPNTWDADMVQGCQADDYGFLKTPYEIYNISSAAGPALSGYDCPRGYNTRLLDAGIYVSYDANYSNPREVQEVYCAANEGSFQLSFRGHTTRSINANASADQLVKLLEELPTLGRVQVSYDEGQTNLCSAPNNYRARVTFVSLVGPVALLEVVNQNVLGHPGEVTVTRLSEGVVEGLFECSGKGDCDRFTGRCKCWNNYGSSDGIGGPGDRGDCGHNLIF